MADTVASLLVEINGDASGLETAIRSAASSLAALEKSSGNFGAGVQKGAEQAAKAVNAHAQNVVKSEEKINESINKGTEQAAKKIVSRSQTIVAAGKKISDIGGAIDDITKPIQTASLVLAAGGVASAKFAVDFENNFASVQKTVDGTPEQLAKIKKGIIDLSTVGRNGNMAIPLDTKQLTELAAIGGQLGIETDNILDFTETMAQLGTATNLSGESGAATLARLMNVTNTSQSSIKNLGSAIVDLGNNFATTEAEIADMSLSMGATAATVGISTQDTLGYATALSSMGIEAEAGGSALQRIWMDMQNAVSSGGDDLNEFAKVSGKSAEEFSKQWKEDASGAFQDFLKGLNTSDDKVGLLDTLGFNNVRDQKALLALAGEKGFGLLTDAIERSNKAWGENTALQNEFNTKAGTTASQLQVTKNNFVEAARSIGETMLPTLKDVSAGAAGFAQKLAGLDEKSKKTIVNTGLAVIGIGTTARVTAKSFQTVGKAVQAFGTIAGAMSPPVAIATAAVAGLALVAGVGKKAYDAWYKSNFKWSEGLSEGNEKVQESLDKYKKLTELKKEVQELQSTITNPEASTEEVDEAKAKLEEIKALLAEEYNLVINSDNSNLDKAIDNVTKLSKNELQYNINTQTAKLNELKPKFDDYKANSEKYQKEADAALELQTAFSDARIALQEYQFTERDGESALDAHNRKIKEQRELVNEYFKNIQDGTSILDKYVNQAGGLEGALDLGFKDYGDKFLSAGEKIKALTASYEEYIAISTEMANWNTELLNMSAIEGDSEGVQKYLSNIGRLVRDAGLDMSGYAQAASLAMNNVSSLEDAWQKGGATLEGVTNDYIRAMREFGASAEDTAVGASLIKNGFHDINEAAQAGKLDVVTQQANDIAHAMGLIPDNKSIKFDVDTNSFDVFDEAAKLEGKDISLKINVDGHTEQLDLTAEQVQKLQGMGAVSIRINADGSIDLIDQANQKIGEIQSFGNVRIAVDADGNVTLLDDASAKVQELINSGQVQLRISADGSGLDLLDQAGNKIAEIKENGDVKITFGVSENTQDSGSILDTIKEWLNPPTAKAADVTMDVNVKPGDINADELSSAIEKAIEGEETGEGGTAEKTVNVNVEATGAESINNIKSMTDSLQDKSITVSVTADGDAAVESLKKAIDDIQDKSAAVTANVTGTSETNILKSSIDAVSGKNVTVQANVIGTAAVNELKAAIDGVQSKTVTITANYVTTGSKPAATGSKYFPGGLAMVNDQKGIADPRELIIDKGRAFIPQGTDVLLPLSKGAKVYTAAQTKTIMKGLGIAQYASGKDNAESIIPIDDWLYKTNVIPTGDSSSLKEWIRRQADSHQEIVKETFAEFMKASENWLKHEEKYNGLVYEDKVDAIKRIESKVQRAYDNGLIKEREYLDTMQKWDEEYLDTFSDMIDEKRQKSTDYISLHSYKNDWAAVGDDPFSAYMRVEDRERWRAETFNDWDTYAEHMSDLSDDMLDDMISAEKEALDFQKEYFGMSAKEYTAGIEKIRVKADEFYNFLDVSSRKQAETDMELNKMILDAKRGEYDDYMKSADNYFKIRETFGDWEDVGDSKTRFYTAELINIEKMYRDKTIGWQQYMDESLDKYLLLYKSVEEEFDDKLQGLNDEISELREVYADKRSSLQKEWDQADRTADMAEVDRLLGIYKNAVTDTGIKKYNDLLEQKKQLERDQQLADLETEENEKIADIEKLYDDVEEDKKNMLKSMRNNQANIFAKVENLPEDTAALKGLADITATNVKDSAIYEATQISSLGDILKAINNVADKVGAKRTVQNVTNNNGRYVINSAAGAQDLIKKLTGTVASGLGSVIIG